MANLPLDQNGTGTGAFLSELGVGNVSKSQTKDLQRTQKFPKRSQKAEKWCSENPIGPTKLEKGDASSSE